MGSSASKTTANISNLTRSKNEHFQLKHPNKHATGNRDTISTTTIPVQILYGFKGDRVVLRVLPDQPTPSTTGTYKKYMEQVADRKPMDPPIFRLPSDKKHQSHFLLSTNWGSIINGKDTRIIRSLVEPPRQRTDTIWC
jgi:hypothetical protein